jgi:hypothetical protein
MDFIGPYQDLRLLFDGLDYMKIPAFELFKYHLKNLSGLIKKGTEQLIIFSQLSDESLEHCCCGP